jgi:hypothetical protein
MNTTVFECMHAVANCSVLQIRDAETSDVDFALVKKGPPNGTMDTNDTSDYAFRPPAHPLRPEANLTPRTIIRSTDSIRTLIGPYDGRVALSIGQQRIANN